MRAALLQGALLAGLAAALYPEDVVEWPSAWPKVPKKLGRGSLERGPEASPRAARNCARRNYFGSHAQVAWSLCCLRTAYLLTLTPPHAPTEQDSGPGYGGSNGAFASPFIYKNEPSTGDELWAFTLTGFARSGVVVDGEGRM